MNPIIEDGCFIAPNAVIIGDVTVESGASIWFGAVLRGDECSIYVGEGTNIQDNVILHTSPECPVKIGKNVSVGHGAVVHGCTVHDNVIIGINATILDLAEIHSWSIVGANALVLEKQQIPGNSLAVGVPAKIVKENDPAISKAVEYNSSKYHELRDQHLKNMYKKF